MNKRKSVEKVLPWDFNIFITIGAFMTDLKNSEVFFAETVSSKVLHDISGFISAVVNTVECLSEENIGKSEFDNLIYYSDLLLNSVRVLRQAYALSDDNMSLKTTLDNLRPYLEYKGCKLICAIKGDFAYDEKFYPIIKSAVNVLLYYASKLVKVKSISIVAEENEEGVKIFITVVARKVQQIFFNEKDNPKTEDFHHNFIVNLLKAYNVSYECKCQDSEEQLNSALSFKQSVEGE